MTYFDDILREQLRRMPLPMYVNMETAKKAFSSDFASGLSEDSDIRVPWEYETLLEMYATPESAIQTERREKRRIGLLKFICNDCASGEHDNCAGIRKHKSHCDCQHKARRKAS